MREVTKRGLTLEAFAGRIDKVADGVEYSRRNGGFRRVSYTFSLGNYKKGIAIC